MANKGRGMVTSVIDFNGVEVYEAGALLITLLAYPGEKEEVWAQVHASLCSYALRIKSASEPDRATVPQPIKPVYAFRLEQDIERDLKTLERRMRDRIIAGRMGIGFLKESVTGQVPEGLKRLSINELAELVLDDAGYSEPENVEARIWRPSLPVIHLATALRLLLHLGNPLIGPIGYETLLLGRNVIELVIRTAEYHRVLFTQSRFLRLDPESLIRIRLL
jgi:hypothetical protein